MGAVAGVVQDIRFARSSDGVQIAYAVHGSGPPLLVDSCWLSHLQFDWQSPVWRHYLVELGRIATVVRFDERGHGLSDRGVTDHSLDARVADLEAVADDAGLEEFAVLAMAQGGPVAIEYTARHPERVSRLAFYGSYAGAHVDASPEGLEMDAAFTALIRVGWDRPTPEFRRVFTSLMIPLTTHSIPKTPTVHFCSVFAVSRSGVDPNCDVRLSRGVGCSNAIVFRMSSTIQRGYVFPSEDGWLDEATRTGTCHPVPFIIMRRILIDECPDYPE
ncbi:MAG: alpha/beta hydrolase, partial [Propionibacteriaceae bacterium]